jgi:hypothetical protein
VIQATIYIKVAIYLRTSMHQRKVQLAFQNGKEIVLLEHNRGQAASSNITSAPVTSGKTSTAWNITDCPLVNLQT